MLLCFPVGNLLTKQKFLYADVFINLKIAAQMSQIQLNSLQYLSIQKK